MAVSLLEALLSDNASDRPQEPFKWGRKGVEIPCQGLFIDELRELRKKAIRVRIDPKTREREEIFDQNIFNDELILASTPGAPWTDERVRQHYGVVEATAAMRKAFRHPADYGALLSHCMKLCGLTDDDGTPAESPEEQVKN